MNTCISVCVTRLLSSSLKLMFTVTHTFSCHKRVRLTGYTRDWIDRKWKERSSCHSKSADQCKPAQHHMTNMIFPKVWELTGRKQGLDDKYHDGVILKDETLHTNRCVFRHFLSLHLLSDKWKLTKHPKHTFKCLFHCTFYVSQSLNQSF